MKETYRPRERIRKKNDFLSLYRKGTRYQAKYFNLIYFPNDLNFSRMAVIVSRKIGNSVKRNKIKRWMRDLFRRNKDFLKRNFDILIIAKKGIQDSSWEDLSENYIAAIKSISTRNNS